MEAVNTILVIISGLCWSGVYILCIRGGFKEKTCCMPLFALGLNIAWEGIYAYLDLFINQTVTVQAIANACWFVLDILIVVTWFRYGQNRNAAAYEKKLFIPWTLLVLVVCFTLQLLFIKTFGQHDGEIYSAYLQNIVMSVSFIYMLRDRRSSRGQSMNIAVLKCIGTLAPTILGTLEGNTFILVTGIICFVFDVLYIFGLHKTIELEQG